MGTSTHGRQRKVQWEDFHLCFQRRGLSELKHFTAVENIPSIFCSPDFSMAPGPGLLSRRLLRERAMTPARLHGWGGKGKALQDYVCLSFHLPVGIIRAETRPPAILLVDLDVITWEGTCFCRTNSASSAVTAEEVFAYQDIEAFESLFRGEYGSQLRYRQAEVLVKDAVPVECIKAVVLPDSEASAAVARRLSRAKWLQRLGGRWAFPDVRFGSWQSLA